MYFKIALEKVNQCPRCQNGKHHSFHCPDNEKRTGNSSATAVVSFRVASIALPVMRLNSRCKKDKVSQRVLLDTGSQHTVIKQALVDPLGLKPAGRIHLKAEGFLKDDESLDIPYANLTLYVGCQYTMIQAIIAEATTKLNCTRTL